MGTRQKLLLFTLVIVWLSVIAAMATSALLIEDQITKQQQDRLTKALGAVHHQIEDDIPLLDKRFAAFSAAEGSRVLREVEPGARFTFDDMMGLLQYFPDVREYLLEFGILEGVTNFAVYLPAAPQGKAGAPGARLYLQFISGMGALIVGEDTAVWWNPRNEFRRDSIQSTAMFPKVIETGPPPRFEVFPGGPGISKTYRLENGGYLTLQRKWDFDLATEQRDLGAQISIHDRDGKVVDGDAPVTDISAHLPGGVGAFQTLTGSQDEDFNTLIKPVMVDGAVTGYVAVWLSRKLAEENIVEVIGLAAAIGVAIMIVGLVMALFLVDSVTLPIFQLMRDCQTIEEGNLDHKIDTSRTDEFGILARAFASMQQAVQGHVRTINQKNSELEIRRDELQMLVDRLQDTERQLSSAFESFSDGFALFDRVDRFIVANEAYLKAYPQAADLFRPGVPFAEIVHRLASNGVYGETPGGVEETIRRRLQAHRSGRAYEYRAVDGRWFEIKDYETQDGGVALVRSDITRRKKAEEERRLAHEEAQQASRAKSEFLAIMSHELRTPLNAILGFSDILARQYFGPPGAGKYQEYAGDIHSSAAHLLELVNDVLDVSAIEAGKVNLEMAPVSLGDIVAECAQTVNETLVGKGVELLVDVPAGLPPAIADRRSIKQVLLNILSNAAKHTPAGGRITVTVRDEDRQLRVTVADTGVGIDPKRLEKVLEPFTHYGGDPYTAAERGWGLGLAISKSLVELHDGSIGIESDLGKGTTVTVLLPRFEPATAEAG